YDVSVISNWLDDGYIFPWLPSNKRNLPRNLARYVIAPSGALPAQLREKAIWQVGSLVMLPTAGVPYANIASVEGGYGREIEKNRWWYWVHERIAFRLSEPEDVG